eukprot:752155-Hanusia_phi.AAC.4
MKDRDRMIPRSTWLVMLCVMTTSGWVQGDATHSNSRQPPLFLVSSSRRMDPNEFVGGRNLLQQDCHVEASIAVNPMLIDTSVELQIELNTSLAIRMKDQVQVALPGNRVNISSGLFDRCDGRFPA